MMNCRPYELYVSLDDLSPRWRGNSGWENEEPLRAALTSLELCFLQIVDSHRDPRRAARKEERIARLWTSAASQIRLLGNLLTASPPPEGPSPPPCATHLCAMRELECSTRAFRQFVHDYDATFEDLPFHVGLEPELNRLRAANGMRPIAFRDERAILPYDTWIAPHLLAAIFQRRTFNAEDRLFATTHQSIECWMFLVLRSLTAADAATTTGDYAGAIESVEQANAIMTYLSDAIMILETMVLSDYHPLRVRLRDASGAQSRQIATALEASRKLEKKIREDLARRSLSYLKIYLSPETHALEYALVEALTTLESRFALFLFNHYKLAGRILGTESLGSLGVEVQTLVARFVKPLFPELDRARYRYSIFTSFAHGQHAGSLVSQLEAELEPRSPEPAPKLESVNLEADRIRAVIAAYFDAMRDMDLERWVSLFSSQGVIESPAGSRPFYGHQGLRIFFRNFMKVFEADIVVTEHAVRIDTRRGHAEVDWRLDVRHDGMPISYTGTETFDFSPTGELLRVTVYDDPQEIARQMLPPSEQRAFTMQQAQTSASAEPLEC